MCVHNAVTITVKFFSNPCLAAVIKENVTVSIYLEKAFKLCVYHDVYGVGQSHCKFNVYSNSSIFCQLKMIVFAEVSSQVESVECVSVSVVISIYIIALILLLLPGTLKETHISHYRLPSSKIWLNRSYRLRLSVQINFHLS